MIPPGACADGPGWRVERTKGLIATYYPVKILESMTLVHKEVIDLKVVKTKNNYRGSNIARKIAKAREEAGLQQMELGIRINADQSTVSRIETGKLKNPKLDRVADIAEATGKAWLLDAACAECSIECARKRMNRQPGKPAVR